MVRQSIHRDIVRLLHFAGEKRRQQMQTEKGKEGERDRESRDRREKR